MRLKFSLFVPILVGCAKKVPPPGKGEFDPPRVIIFSPSFGDTLNGEFELNLEAQDNSGVYKVEVFKGGTLIGAFGLKGKRVTLDTLLKMVEEGEDYFPDTLQIKVFDRWDNVSSLSVEVFTRRKPPKKEVGNGKGTGDEGGKDSGGENQPKGP